jgi:VCBS repeat-containing protein
MSQAEVASRAGTSRPTLSAYEGGSRNPTLDTLERVLAANRQHLVSVPDPVFTHHADWRGKPFFVPDQLPRLPVEAALATVRIPVLGANQEPVVSSVVVGLPDPQTGVVKGRVTATDADGDAVVFGLVPDASESSGTRTVDVGDVRVRSLPAEVIDLPYATAPTSQGSVSLQADGAFTYTPVTPGSSTSSTSTDSFTVTATDGYGGSTSIPVSVPVGGSYGGGIQQTASSSGSWRSGV